MTRISCKVCIFLIFGKLQTFGTELSVEEVQNVQLGKLAIRFGVPYVLLHLGDCEHKLVFKDLFADVCEEAQKVCKTVFLKPPKPRTCGACRMKNSVFVCHNHELADASPYFLCSGKFSFPYWSFVLIIGKIVTNVSNRIAPHPRHMSCTQSSF